MAVQTVFQRYELKYLLTNEQKTRILQEIAPKTTPDRYGRSTIRNVYFDTESYRLIRRSIEKPAYKEKLRLRSYALAEPDQPVFVELKKKYQGIVYKRRLALPQADAMAWLAGETPCPVDSQISREIAYFLEFYGGLRPTVFLSYRREAYYSAEDSAFRVTFDDEILCRRTELSLGAAPGGRPILPPETTLMEVKCAGGLPLWMTKILTREGIRKASFSKYGTAYQTLIFPNFKEDFFHATNFSRTF